MDESSANPQPPDPPGPKPQSSNPATPSDTSGWAQPPAPVGPLGAFVDRQPVPSVSLPPGAGSPVQPGPPLSVSAPIRDTTINWAMVAIIAIGVVLVLLFVAFIGAALVGHTGGGRS
jgi:hypothetical protein